MDEYFNRQDETEREEGRTESVNTETEETVREEDSREDGNETEAGVEDVKAAEMSGNAETFESANTATGMTDEEIRKAAENIGSPYTSYEYSNANTAGKNTSNSYGSYSYGSTGYSYSAGNANASESTNNGKNEKHTYKSGKGLKAAKFLAIAACFGMLAGACFFGTERALSLAFPEDEETTAAETQAADNARQTATNVGVTSLIVNNSEKTSSNDDSVVVEVVKENMSATVAISATYVTSTRYFGQTYQYESQGGGSGFIVGRNETELLVATNNHVVESVKELKVVFCDDTSVTATVRATDSDNDLAIVSVKLSDIPAETLSAIKIATLGNSDDSEVGEMVIAIGNALGYGQSVTVGYLSAKDREVKTDNGVKKLLQTDAAINSGNSGGPLFNTEGEVIGINCAKYSDTSVEGMCFAIPISKAIPILEDLMTVEKVAEEDQGYLGITIKTITEDISSFYGWPMGVYVYSVVDNGSAAEAGIKFGDIITAVNGKKTLTDETLKATVNQYKYGTTVMVTVMRANEEGVFEEKNIEVTLMKKPNT